MLFSFSPARTLISRKLCLDSSAFSAFCPSLREPRDVADSAALTRFLSSMMTFLISPAERFDCSASFRISAAITAKPLPCSPARAAWIDALIASTLVWFAISSMESTIVPILSVSSLSERMVVSETMAASSIDLTDSCITPTAAELLIEASATRRAVLELSPAVSLTR